MDNGKLEKVIKQLEALYDAMHKNQCYACSYEFVEVAKEFGTEIIADAIETLKEQDKEIKMLKLMGLKIPEILCLSDEKPIYKE